MPKRKVAATLSPERHNRPLRFSRGLGGKHRAIHICRRHGAIGYTKKYFAEFCIGASFSDASFSMNVHQLQNRQTSINDVARAAKVSL